MATIRVSAMAAAVLALGLAAACTTARRSEPLGASLSGASESVHQGQLVFMQHCQKCHPGGEAGEGPSLNNVPLPGTALRLRVRSRAFFLGVGRMPSFKKEEISPEQLDNLVSYLKAVRRSTPDKALTQGAVRAPRQR